MYNNDLVSHEQRCNGMITLSYRKSNKKTHNEKAYSIANRKYGHVDHRIPRELGKPDYRYIIDYTHDGEKYDRAGFIKVSGLSKNYLLYITTKYVSCHVDGILCTFGYAPMRKTKFTLTMQDGTVYDKVTAEWISEKLNVSTQHIYGCKGARGNKIQKVEE